MSKRIRLSDLVVLFQRDELTPETSEQLYASLLKMVHKLLGTIHLPPNWTTDKEDIVCEGVTTALEMARDYDAEQASFYGYAFRRVRGAMVDYIRCIDPLSRQMRNVTQEVLDLEASAETVTDEEILERTGIKPSALARMRRQYYWRNTVSLDRTQWINSKAVHDGEKALYEKVGKLDRELEAIANQNGVMLAIKQLPTERERDILLRYHLQEHLLREIGRDYGLTEARISQIRKQSEETLRRTIPE